MSIKPRLVIEVNPELLLRLRVKAAERSVDQGGRVTIKDIVLQALVKQYPDLSDIIGVI